MSQLFEDGKVINVDGTELECTGVSYQEIDGVKQNIQYVFRAKSEVDAERKALAEAEELRLAAENIEPVTEAEIQATQPQPIKEEIQNVK